MRQAMEFGCGYLRWPPDVVWRATVAEVEAAQAGFLASKGVSDGGRSAAPPTRDRLEELMTLYPDRVGHG